MVGVLIAVAATAQAREVVLHVAVTDGGAFSQQDASAIDRYISAKLPGERLVSIGARRTMGLRSKEAVAAELKARIAAVELAPDERITHLIIDTHGDTVENDGKLETKLTVIGNIADDGPNKDFDDIFAPIRGKLSRGATIVLNSCSTLCGTNDQAAARAKALLSYFGADAGRVYGAESLEMAVPGKLNKEFRLRDWIRLGDMGAMIPSLMMALDGAYGLLTHTTPTDAAIAQLAFTSFLFARPILNWTGLFNRGRIFIFDHGALTTVVPVRRYVNEAEIYNTETCSDVFGS